MEFDKTRWCWSWNSDQTTQNSVMGYQRSGQCQGSGRSGGCQGTFKTFVCFNFNAHTTWTSQTIIDSSAVPIIFVNNKILSTTHNIARENKILLSKTQLAIMYLMQQAVRVPGNYRLLYSQT